MSGSKPGERRGGRPKGGLNKRTLELLSVGKDDDGISPKEVMLRAMRHWWAQGNFIEAVECAAKVAPYEHPRLTSLDARLDQRVSVAIDDAGERLAYEIARLAATGNGAASPQLPKPGTTH